MNGSSSFGNSWRWVTLTNDVIRWHVTQQPVLMQKSCGSSWKQFEVRWQSTSQWWVAHVDQEHLLLPRSCDSSEAKKKSSTVKTIISKYWLRRQQKWHTPANWLAQTWPIDGSAWLDGYSVDYFLIFVSVFFLSFIGVFRCLPYYWNATHAKWNLFIANLWLANELCTAALQAVVV